MDLDDIFNNHRVFLFDVTCELAPMPHMIDRMNERGISSIDIKEAILKGQKKHRNDSCTITKFKSIEVIYKEVPCHYFGITTYHI